MLFSVGGCGVLWSRGDPVVTERLRLADVALADGMTDLALQLSDDALKRDPKNTHAQEIKADVMAASGHEDEAVALWQTVLTREPGSVRANAGLGKARLKTDPAAAERYFQAAVKGSPRDVALLNDLGIARDYLGRHDEARENYRQALAIAPGDVPSTVDLALSMGMSGQAQAAVALLAPLASAPDASRGVRHNYAMVLAMAGRRAEAEKILGADMPAKQAREVLAQMPGVSAASSGGSGAPKPAAGAPRPAAGAIETVSTSKPVPLESRGTTGRGGS